MSKQQRLFAGVESDENRLRLSAVKDLPTRELEPGDTFQLTIIGHIEEVRFRYDETGALIREHVAKIDSIKPDDDTDEQAEEHEDVE